jgi:hypothetical protein
VKICLQNAIEVRHYADIVPLGGPVQPLRGSDSIMWTIKFRNGTIKRFKFPTRTTSEGSIDPYGGKSMPKLADITKPGFFTASGGYRAGRADEMQKVLTDDTELMLFGFRFLRQTLFGEVTIPVRADTAERRRTRAAERQARLERGAAERLAREEEGDVGID